MQSIVSSTLRKSKNKSSQPRSSQQSNSSIYSRMLRSNKALSQEETGKQEFNQFEDIDDDNLIAGFEPQNILDLEIDPIQGKRYLVKYKDASYKLCTWQKASTLQRFGDLLPNFNSKLQQGLIKLGEGKKKYKKALSRLKKREEQKKKIIEDEDSKKEVEESGKNLKIRKKRGKYNKKKVKTLEPKVTKKYKGSKGTQEDSKKEQNKKTKNKLTNSLKENNLNQPQEERKKLKQKLQTLNFKNKDSQQSQQTTTFNPLNNKKFGTSNSQGYISSQSFDSQLQSQSSLILNIQSQQQLPVVIGDEPEKVARIWQEVDGRVFIRVEWKQKEGEGKILPTIYGIESFPPAGYKLLMNFLVAKYKKAMKWD